VAVASAGLYASLHLIPDNHTNIPPLRATIIKGDIIQHHFDDVMVGNITFYDFCSF